MPGLRPRARSAARPLPPVRLAYPSGTGRGGRGPGAGDACPMLTDPAVRTLAPSVRRDFSRIRAIVIDENNAARKVMRDLLSGMGIGQVQQSTDPVRAIRQIEQDRFGLVLCEWRFQSPVSGGQVLEYLRTRRLLAPGAAFVLISSDASRPMLAVAQEWQPDGFILKPLTPAALTPRIEQALRRRAEFAAVHEASDRQDHEAVLQRLATLVAHAGAPTLEAMRWQVQALLALGRFDEARGVCEQALIVKDGLAWAELGLARIHRSNGKLETACERARAILRANPYFGGAYDLLIEIHQERGEAAEAVMLAQTALRQLATAKRARTLGEVAYAHGELEVAEQTYADLVRRNSASLTRSGIDVGMLGQVLVAQGAPDRALQLLSDSQSDLNGDVSSQALAASVAAQAHSARGDSTAATTSARRALQLAGSSVPDERVSLLVAQGAFTAGLRGEAEALLMRTMRDGRSTSPLARSVMAKVGMTAQVSDPEAAQARAKAMIEDGAPVAKDVEDALAALRAARFDEAVTRADRALQRLPKNPLVLMTAVQAHLLRMRAHGYDPDTARLVRRCLVEIDRQIPGDERVFPFQ